MKLHVSSIWKLTNFDPFINDCVLLPRKTLANHMVLLIMPRFESSKMSYLRLAAAHLGIVMTIRSLKLRCYLFDQR